MSVSVCIEGPIHLRGASLLVISRAERWSGGHTARFAKAPSAVILVQNQQPLAFATDGSCLELRALLSEHPRLRGALEELGCNLPPYPEPP